MPTIHNMKQGIREINTGILYFELAWPSCRWAVRGVRLGDRSTELTVRDQLSTLFSVKLIVGNMKQTNYIVAGKVLVDKKTIFVMYLWGYSKLFMCLTEY